MGWKGSKHIASGSEIQEYLQETIDEFHIRDRIRFNTHITKADWRSGDARWRLEAEDGAMFSCSFLFSCGGYYLHDAPYQPVFPGADSFHGLIVHPQLWRPEHDKSYQGKRVAVIGSGATAVTLVPNMAKRGAAHVAMVQRTPTYMAVAPD